MAATRMRSERDGDIAVIVIGKPPIHAGSAAVRKGLMAAIVIVNADASLQAAVGLAALSRSGSLSGAV